MAEPRAKLIRRSYSDRARVTPNGPVLSLVPGGVATRVAGLVLTSEKRVCGITSMRLAG